jgi:hypothetical protein
LNDPPHLTVYLANFPSKQRVLEAAAQLAGELPSVDLQIVGWHVFTNDQLTGNHTLVFQFDDRTQMQLRAFQRYVIERLASLRDIRATIARYVPQFQLLSCKRREAVEEYGFPFVGADWHPHFTVASIRPKDWQPVAQQILPNAPQISESCGRLTIYELQKSEPVALVSHPLREFKVAA